MDFVVRVMEVPLFRRALRNRGEVMPQISEAPY